MIKQLLSKIRNIFYYFFNNLFYFPYVFRSLNRQIQKMKGRQIFFVARNDFGTWLMTLLYILCWQRKRGKTCLINLSQKPEIVKCLALLLSPETKIISPQLTLLKIIQIIFGKIHVHFHTLMSAFTKLTHQFQDSLFLFSPVYKANYTNNLNKILNEQKHLFSHEFCNAYEQCRNIYDIHQPAYYDFINLYYETCSDEPFYKCHNELNLGSKYVVLNAKTNNTPRRNINFPERYNVIIDHLIEKGFQVVIQGRNEQPQFKSRKGLVDYSRSSFASVENDLALYSGCAFAITSKTGPEVLTALCNVPLLGLNYVELASMQPNLKMRYFPKLVLDKSKNQILSWNEFLKHPSFFEMGDFHCKEIELIDLNEEEMLEALKEFLPLIDQPNNQWLQFTKLQKEFTQQLNLLHLDLFHVKSVPLDCYLKRTA